MLILYVNLLLYNLNLFENFVRRLGGWGGRTCFLKNINKREEKEKTFMFTSGQTRSH